MKMASSRPHRRDGRRCEAAPPRRRLHDRQRVNSLATASVPHRSSCIKTWKGEAGNVDAAQKQLLARAQANGEASKGEYVPGSQPSDEESLFVKNYVY